MLMSLIKPSTAASKELKTVGLTTQQISDEMKVSLPGTIEMITDAVGRKFPVGSSQYTAAIANIVGGSKQMKAILELSGGSLKTFIADTAATGVALNGGSKSITGWSLVQKDFNQRMSEAQGALEAVGIQIGQALLPVVSDLLGAVTPIITAFSSWITNSGVLQSALSGLTGGIGGMATVISGAFGQMQQNTASSMLQMKNDSITKSLNMAQGVVANIEYQRRNIEQEMSQTTSGMQRAMLQMQFNSTNSSLLQAQGVVAD